MQQINCSDCKDEKCPQRIEGALCVKNNETAQLCKIYETRDPILISRHLVGILVTEKERYDKAVKQEDIGAMGTKPIVTKSGEVIEVEYEKEPNPAVTDIAKSIIKSGKVIHDIVNPPKAAPYIQQNNQYNFGTRVADEIMNLPDKERVAQIAFIDEKLNA